MAIDPGPRAPQPAAGSAYSVVLGVLEAHGHRVRAAATTTGELASSPSSLPQAVTRAGSGVLERAAADFADAWTRECAALAHDTRLLGDALLQTASAYRSTEWAVGRLVSPALVVMVDDR